MSSTAMTPNEREAFLADVHVGVVAVNRDGRAPLTVPIWYGYEPDGDVVLWTGLGSLKERLIRAAGRFSICVQDEKPPYKYVTAEGPVIAVDEAPTFEEASTIARRYLPRDEADGFVKSIPGDHVIIRMRPEKWLSFDSSKA